MAPGPSTKHHWVFSVDFLLVATTILVATVGVVMVYTATRWNLIAQGLSPHYFLYRQAAYVALGVGAMVVTALFDYRKLEPFAMAIYGLIILSLVGVFVVGSHALGSQRWYSFGPLQLQPSEFAVLGLILAVATYCSRRTEGLTWRDVSRLLILAGVPIVLVMIQPDLGTAIIMVIVLFVMLAVAGLPGRVLFILVASGVVVIVVALVGGFLHHYQIARLTSFLHQGGGIQQPGIYNLVQAKDAIGSGGIWGTGLGRGVQTNLGYVPEQQTDFIFTAVGEQLGFVGASIVLGLLGFITWRILRAAQVARDPFGRLLCAGVFTFVGFSVFQNAGMTMGIMPITGIPLPFVSYGGTAVLCFFLAVGLALSVYARRH
ncbi:MAG: rod shape-determining protein RodA [Acidimicrobiales bacterium]|nr:rod shape-determining protein RodA [Actinomycetota bacterium]